MPVVAGKLLQLPATLATSESLAENARRQRRRAGGTIVEASSWTLTCILDDASETRRWGAALGELLQPGHLILLSGPLGAGKTVFTQGVGAGLGVGEPVTSPTFTLVHYYHAADGTGPLLVHADLYRLEDPAEVEGLGLEDAMAVAPVVVEWWQRAEGFFPPGRLEVELEPLKVVPASPASAQPPEVAAGVPHGASLSIPRRLRARATDAVHQRLLEAWIQRMGHTELQPER